jgi:uncharacterized protein
MRADLSTSGRATIPNERGLEAASDPARIAAPNLSRLVVFLVVTLTTTWLAFLPMIMGVVANESTAGFFLLLVGIGAPSITAFLLTAAHDGRDGVRRLGRGGIRWRVPARWYLALVAIPALAFGGSWAMAAVAGGPTVIYPLVPAIISGLLAGLLEEFGWTGFAFPALQARFGFAGAGAAVGVIVAVWHLPFFLLPGTTQNASSFVMFLLILIAARIVFGYLYNVSGGSILLAILLHAFANTWAETLGTGSDNADAAGLTKLGVFSVAALVAVWLTRRRASRLDERQ